MYIGKKVLIFSLLVGLAVTLLTYPLINSVVIGEFPNIRFVSLPIMGVSYWGYPLPWMKQIVYPGAMRELIWSHLVIDITYWTGLVLVVKVYYLKQIRVRQIRVKEKLAKKVRLISEIRPIKRPTKKPARKPKPKRRAKRKIKRKKPKRKTRSTS